MYFDLGHAHRSKQQIKGVILLTTIRGCGHAENNSNEEEILSSCPSLDGEEGLLTCSLV